MRQGIDLFLIDDIPMKILQQKLQALQNEIHET
jgi:hypothetical protein